MKSSARPLETGTLAVAAALIVIPLSVDNLLSISWLGFHFRINYFGHALALAAVLAAALFDRERRSWLLNYIKSKSTVFFALMAASGLIGVASSENFRRSCFFLVWSAGTLLTVPLVVFALSRCFKLIFLRLASGYLAIQGFTILIDSLACSLKLPFHLGRAVNFGEHVPFCRPQAWYQEPAYFCSFALISLLWIRRAPWMEKEFFWKAYGAVCFALTAVGIILSTSNTGWLGLVAFLFFEAIFLLNRYRDSGAIRKWIRENRGRALSWAGISALFLVGLSFLFSSGLSYTWSRLSRLEGFSTEQVRYQNARISLAIFGQKPWFGAGPGSSSAYLVLKMPEEFEKWRQVNNPKVAPETYANDPFSYTLWGELLSEWGIIGASFFVLGFLYLFYSSHFSRIEALQFAAVFFVVSMTWQTISRYDLWFSLSMLATWTSVSRAGKKSVANPSLK